MIRRIPRVVRAGLVAGIVSVYLCLVGVVGSLVTNVVGKVTVGRVLLSIPAILAGFLVARPRVVSGDVHRPSVRAGVSAGAIVGLTTGALLAIFIGVVNLLGIETVRNVFIAVKPELMSLLTFGHAGVVGSVLRIGAEVALGAVGGAIGATQDRIRVPTVIAATVVISLGLLRRIVHPALAQLGLRDDWLFSVVTLGLTWFGAAAVFVVTFVTTFAWRANSAAIVARTHRTPATERGVRVVVLAVIGAGLIALPFLIGSIFSQILGTVGIYILLGLGLNIVVGYAGLLDLGYVAFFAVGAYTTAILTGGSRVTTTGYAPPSFVLHLSFFVAIPIVVAVAALVGLVIGAPVLRLRGDYLAIVTLGFGEIARVLFSSDWLKGAFGGTQGITAIPAAPIGNLDFRDTQHFYFLVLGFCLVAVYISWRLADSRVGRAWNAMREDEQVAEAVGVSTVRYKLLAFAMGGAIGSLGGALFAVQVGALNNASFMLLVSITALAVVILGGMGSIPGVIVGALVLIGIPGVFSEFEQYRLLLYGAVLMAIMILRPQGLIPNVRRSQELEEEDVAQDKWAGAVTADEQAAPVASPLGEGAG
ncbi:MAG TPA: leucine/isoleucine/valine transporter permease subunit [Actinomycetota bacterium]|nr:leucine/isoleucine/valine transporter permease subunit [Actinomycetota bacterium]